MHDSQRIFSTKPFPYFVSGYTKRGYFTLSERFVQRGYQERAPNKNNSALTMHFFGALVHQSALFRCTSAQKVHQSFK